MIGANGFAPIIMEVKMIGCKTLYLNSLFFFVSVITMKSHGAEWFYTALIIVSVFYIIGFFKIEKSNSELKLSILDALEYSILGRLFDKVLVREVSFFFEIIYVSSMIVVFYLSMLFIRHFEFALILSFLFPAILNFTFIKLGFFKFYEAMNLVVSE